MRNKIALLLTLSCFLPIDHVAAQFSWKTLPNAPFRNGRHEDIFFVNENYGWVVNLLGQIFKTADGGKTWIKQYEQAGARFRSVGFADSSNGWAGTLDNALLYQTKNGGNTWTPVPNIPNPRPAGICGISVVNANVIYASGRYDGPARVIKSIDGGTTWAVMDLAAQAKTLIDCYFWSPDSGMVVGGNGTIADLNFLNAVIVTTFDGGKTWQTRRRTTRIGEWCWKISFPSRRTGYVSLESAANSRGYCLKTTDGGLTWQEKLITPGLTAQGIGFVTAQRGWIGGRGRPYETLDGGETWRPAADEVLDYAINRVRVLSDTLAYAVGNTVYKYSRDHLTTVDFPAAEKPPARYRLEQNFPNPFWSAAASPAKGGGNPITTIKFSLTQSTVVKMQVLNLAGQILATLLDAEKPAGQYEVYFDAAKLASGIYFYRLQAGNVTLTRKMLIAK